MTELRVTYWQRTTAAQQAQVTAAFGALEAWERMPRYRAACIAIGWHESTPVACTVVAHERLLIGNATVEVGVLRHHAVAAGAGPGILAELLMQQALVLLAEGIACLALHGAVAEWQSVGFAPVSYLNQIVWPTTSTSHALAPGSYQVCVPDADQMTIIRSMQLSQSLIGYPHIVDVVRAEPSSWLLSWGRDGQLQAAVELLTTPHETHIVRGVACHQGAALDAVMALMHAPDVVRPVRMALPFRHPLSQAAVQCHASIVQALPTTHTTLLGVLDLPAMLTALIPAFQERIRASAYADWQGGVRIEISDERAMIVVAGGEITVIDGSRDAHVRMRHVEVPALAQLLLGFRSVAMLRRMGMLACDDTELPLLEILFPELYPVVDLS
jgi:hypothetical protein